jgi:hypothetical protein
VTSAAVTPTPHSARLTGIVVPEGDTTYHFEWGRTARLGKRTKPEVVPAGAGATPVKASIGSLRPDTRYRFRLVATGPGGPDPGDLQIFRTPPLPRVELAIPVVLGCNPGAHDCRINRSSLDIKLLESDGRLARASRLAALRVRIVLRRGDRVLGRTSFRARARVHPPTLRGRGRATVRRRIVDGVAQYPLGRLMRGRMVVGTRLDAFVTRRGTIGGYFRLDLRPNGRELPDTIKRRCDIRENTAQRRMDCHNL